jgi:hypothetical protein
MTNGSKPAFPFIWNNETQVEPGMTLLENASIAAMRGLLSNLDESKNGGNSRYFVNDGHLCYEAIAKDAIGCAKELLKQLENNQK